MIYQIMASHSAMDTNVPPKGTKHDDESANSNSCAIGGVASSSYHFNALNDSRESDADVIFNYKAPRRMFLGDIPLYLQEQTIIGSKGGKDLVVHDSPGGSVIPNNNLVRLMGKVVEILNESRPAPSPAIGISEISSCDSSFERKRDSGEESQTMLIGNVRVRSNSSVGQPVNEAVYKTIRFVIDDGTGTIDVITRRRTGKNDGKFAHGSSMTGPAVKPKQNPYATKYKTQLKPQNELKIEDTPRHVVSISNVVSAPPPSITLGNTVDCVGQIHVDEFDENKIWLQASSVSIIKNPQEETLRQFELSSSVGENLQSEMMNPIIQNNAFFSGCPSYRDGGIPMNGIIAGGNLTYKLCPLHYRVPQQSYRQSFSCNPTIPEAVLNTDDAYRFIRCSRNDGGIFANDLELLVGASRPSEKRAVRMAVEELQKQGMVYMKEGKYFPL